MVFNLLNLFNFQLNFLNSEATKLLNDSPTMKTIAEGNTKVILEAENPTQIVMRFKDTASAYHGIKRATIEGKGALANRISARLFSVLAEAGVENHFVRLLSDNEQLCLKTEVLPLRVIVRNVAAGSIVRRFGIEEGTEFRVPVYEMNYKSAQLDDPFLNEHTAVAFGIVSYDEMALISQTAHRANEVLIKFFDSCGIRLIDFKLEFGRTPDGRLILADDISPDTSRLWDRMSGQRLDKDRFRRDMGDIIEAYKEVCERVGG